MAILRIPSSEYKVLKKLAELEETLFSALIKAVQEIDTPFVDLNAPEKLTAKVPLLKALQLKAILRTVAGLYSIKSAQKKSAEQIANELRETVESEEPKDFPPEKAIILKGRIEKLLSIGKAIEITAKALTVMTTQDRIFCGIKVLSDIRPVFDAPADSMTAAMVVHNLNIHYHQDGKHKEFFAAMNTSDVRKIREAMERAEKKGETLKSLIQKSEVHYFEDQE